MAGLRALDDQNLLVEYLTLKAEAKRIDERLKELQPVILDAALSEPDLKDGDYFGCKLAVTYRKQWEYSKELTAMENEVKAAKRFEESTGKATLLGMTPSLTVTVPKNYTPAGGML